MSIIWKQNIALTQLNNHRSAGLGEVLGIKIVARGTNWLTAEMPVTEKHKQPFGIVHGGATAALAETVASIAAWLCVDAKKQGTVGLELNINHLKAVTKGILTARATAIHVGRLTHVWQIDIHNQDFNQVSTSRLTITVINK
ncbi:MAG: PaaI family thioesterase [Alcanivoracaceae bacterium]|nr:PaaI family thioesterase [Alcanivoracaceae bacterium]